MRKKERAAIVIERLKKEYPGADCTLDYNEAWKLLVSVRLAAQCTDERVNIIVKDLFAKYPGVNELAEAEPEDIEAIVRPCGLGKSKARDISKCMRMLRDEFGSLKTSGSRKKKCKPHYGGCLWQTCDCNRHTLHPSL